MKRVLFLLMLLSAYLVNAQDYEIWGTVKVETKASSKWTIAIEAEDRYNFDAGNIRYFHYEAGALYSLTNTLKAGLFYRNIFENKNDVISRVTVPHGDVIYSKSGFGFRTRLEYITKYQDHSHKFRLRIRPGYQSNIWNNFNPFVQNEVFLTSIDELVRNRLNVGITVKVGAFQIRPGYLLETNNKDVWTSKNILWINTKIKI